MIHIAVDAMGGDYAPRHVVDGALAAVRHFDLGVLLVGPTSILEEELARHADVDQRRVRIIEADEVVTMEESPTAALRRKPAASIRIAAAAVASGEAAALFSAGHTGATVMAAHAAFGMLPGVDRPALAAVIVCDGFTGNVALKISEGLVEAVEELLSEELSSTVTMRVGSLLTRRALRRFHRRVDYSEYGGAPLLGVAGVTIVGHGRSSAKAVRNAIAMAYRFADNRFIERVQREIAAAAVSAGACGPSEAPEGSPAQPGRPASGTGGGAPRP